LAVKTDIIHFEWNSAAMSFLPFWDLLDAKTVISCRGSQVHIAPLDPNRPQWAKDLKSTFVRATAVHCVSEAILKEAEHYGLDPKKAMVNRPAVDMEFFVPPLKRPESDTVRIVSVGSLIWRKGYEHALVSVNLLRNEGYRVSYEIIGDGPERQRILYTILDLGLEDCVTLTGSLSPDDVRARLQHADVFLLSSLSEGISNAALEAMACGLPVVTTDCGGMREAITDGVEGIVVPVRDPAAMAEALVRLGGDPVFRNQMGERGRERVLEDFTLQRQIGQFINLYRHLTLMDCSDAP
jgi:colanic acid/amylovoran biosynthesis glycosyltransferase